MGINLDDGLKDEVAAVYKWYATNRAKVLYVAIGIGIGLMLSAIFA